MTRMENMVVMARTLILMLFLIAGCSQPKIHPLQSKQAASGDWSLPYGKWSFSFITPWRLPARVRHVRVLDTDGYLYIFRMLDKTAQDPNSVTIWTTKPHGGSVNFNLVKMPPQYMIFCWDSFIDRKTYETSVLFSPATWQRMKTPAEHLFRGKVLWYDNMLFGLSPGGHVRIWFPDGGSYPAPIVTPHKISTVSGADLTLCKQEGADGEFLRKYRYSQEIEDGMKGKTYPYGEW
ncbi:DUF2931 family protein [Kluyvera ascorbata]|uniref:DUF2931 family protein n=1 Tax=Kluyvera ascorbata TaxID=51288 RepID=UPI0018A4927C|nr:DUF2931 family protein [Kluyvera ascorbata]MDU3912748.1 DUF2931 family protein [Kluyvera ascorbata]UPQ72019.1 DUF2931 family protein [Kluyvera ascorbata]BBV63929.1 lipoprotein [Klebsiella sp. STW0522-44]